MKQLLKYISLLIILITLFWSCEKGPDFKEYTYPAQQSSGINPASGYAGTYVTITGTNFDTLKRAVKVWFGGILADSVISCQGDQIVVKVPAGAVSGRVGLQVWTTKSDSIGVFTVIPTPNYSSISADRAKANETVTISGENFGTDIAGVKVYIGSNEAEIVSVSNTKIQFKVPDVPSGALVLKFGSFTVKGPYFFIGDEKISGNLIGHSGSWGNNTATMITAAVDGNLTTFVDGATATGYVGYDFGSGKGAHLTLVRYAPRTSHPQRMVGGEIRGANDPTLYDYEVLYTITQQPPTGVFTDAIISTSKNYRYIYYYSPNGYCNLSEIEFYGNVLDVPVPAGKYIFEFDDPSGTAWIPQQNSTYVIENNKLKVTFDPVQFTGTSKRRADLKFMNTPWIYTKDYPIMAIKFTKPAVVNFRPDITGLSSGFTNNDYKKDFESKNVYYWDLSEKTTSDRVECGIFQFKIPDITSAETGYEVDWVRTFKTQAELQTFLGL